MKRRHFLSATGTAWVAGLGIISQRPAKAHTPYNQWRVYRKKHLLIGCHRQDATTYSLAQQLVRTIDDHLPAAKSRVARAPHPQRLASLLGTDQLQYAVLDTDQATDLINGDGEFKPYGEISLRAVWKHANYLLFAREDVPIRHAWLLASALDERRDLDQSPPNIKHPSINHQWHAGVTAYFQGKPMPD